MNGYVASWLHILPDQAMVLNSIFILLFIPLFKNLYGILDRVIYPGFVTKLRRMSLGMLFAAAAFACSAGVQSLIDVNLTPSPAVEAETSLNVMNLAVGDPVEG